ncbi:MAG: hypothetical protein ABIP74_01055 [Candidatus Saccharimonas sp.]
MEPSKEHEVVPHIEQASTRPAGEDGIPTRNYEFNSESQVEKVPEIGQVQAEISQIAMPSLPTPVLTAPGAVAAQTQADDTPLVAGDDDVIEKEWVEKVKSIIAATKDDPYRREQEINKLQIDYLRKRYGREIGSTGE